MSTRWAQKPIIINAVKWGSPAPNKWQKISGFHLGVCYSINNPILRGRKRSPWLLTTYSSILGPDPPGGVGYTWRIIPVSKWLVTMVIVSPLSRATFPFQMAFSWLTNGGDPNYLLSGMILQVIPLKCS